MARLRYSSVVGAVIATCSAPQGAWCQWRAENNAEGADPDQPNMYKADRGSCRNIEWIGLSSTTAPLKYPAATSSAPPWPANSKVTSNLSKSGLKPHPKSSKYQGSYLPPRLSYPPSTRATTQSKKCLDPPRIQPQCPAKHPAYTSRANTSRATPRNKVPNTTMRISSGSLSTTGFSST